MYAMRVTVSVGVAQPVATKARWCVDSGVDQLTDARHL